MENNQNSEPHSQKPKNSQKPKEVCVYFQRGQCKWGNICKYLHTKSKKQLKDTKDKKKYIFVEKENQNEQQKMNNKFENNKIQKPKRKFLDISQTKQGKEIFEINNLIWNGDFLSYIKTIKDSLQINIAQLQRRYQCSYQEIQPTLSPDELGLNFVIEEQYLLLECVVNLIEKVFVKLTIENKSIPPDFKRLFEQECDELFKKYNNDILKVLKHIDNYFDKICEKITQEITNLFLAQYEEEEKNNQTEWTQEEQSLLEKYMKEFNNINDKNQKYQKIGSLLGRTSAQIEAETQKNQNQKSNEEIENKGNLTENQNNTKLSKIQERQEQYEEQKQEEEQVEEENQENQEEDDADEYEQDEENQQDQEEEEEEQEQEHDPFSHHSFNYVGYVDGLNAKNIGYSRISLIKISAQCKRCREISELILDQKVEGSQNYTYNNESCTKCEKDNPCLIACKKEFLQYNHPFIARFGSFTWVPRDIRKADIDISCSGCGQINLVRDYTSGQNTQFNCFSCFKQIEFFFESISLEDAMVRIQQQLENLERQAASDKTYQKKKVLFKIGGPLPNNGTCKHYKNSFRLFRFPCCQKAYPCDDCHIAAEKHEIERAKTMFCGYCSQEQVVSNECKRCSKPVTKASGHSEHWEGGKGCRNKISMSRKDVKKFSGLSKTLSRKQQTKKDKS